MPDGTPPDFTLPVVGAPYNNKDGSDRRFEILDGWIHVSPQLPAGGWQHQSSTLP